MTMTSPTGTRPGTPASHSPATTTQPHKPQAVRTDQIAEMQVIEKRVDANGLPIMGYGFVFKWYWLLAIGALISFFGVNAWTIEPATEEHH